MSRQGFSECRVAVEDHDVVFAFMSRRYMYMAMFWFSTRPYRGTVRQQEAEHFPDRATAAPSLSWSRPHCDTEFFLIFNYASQGSPPHTMSVKEPWHGQPLRRFDDSSISLIESTDWSDNNDNNNNLCRTFRRTIHLLQQRPSD